MKKVFALAVVMFAIFAACGGNEPPAPAAPAAADPAPPAAADTPAADPVAEADPAADIPTGAIHVITREDGSGTRDAFVDVTGIYEGGVDRTWDEAIVESGTGAVITAVAGNPAAMGYISLGAMRDDVRPLPVEGVEPSVETILAGTYPLFRSFYLAVPQEASLLTQDFIRFILSAEGQDIVAGRGYVTPVLDAAPYDGGEMRGTIEIEGSTSVAPIMSMLADAYSIINPAVRIDVHSTGSGAGITAAREGRVDLGMSSRTIRAEEFEELGDSITVAHDGIAVIVHPSNALPSVSVEEIRQIFMGELFRWEDIE